jgi:hypothetical protein
MIEETQSAPTAEFEDSEEDIQDFIAPQNQLNSLTNGILLIKNIFKRAPELLPIEINPWIEFCVMSMDGFSDDLCVAAILGAAYGVLRIGAYPPFFIALIKSFESESGTVIGAAFKVVSRFLEADLEMPKELLSKALEIGKSALKQRLDCQDRDAEDETSSISLQTNVYRFYAALASKSYADFPLDLFVDHGNSIIRPFEKSQYIGVLRQFYTNHFVEIPSLTKKFVIKSFLGSLSICIGGVLPEPILAIRAVLEREAVVIENQLPEVLQFLQEILDRENEGEVHYWSTMTDGVSLLCTVMRVRPEGFDIGFWLPKMLAKLPVRGDEMEADHIYETIAGVSEVIAEMEGGVHELIRVYAQTLALKDKVLESLHLKRETYGRMLEQLRVLAAHPQYGEVLGVALPTEALRVRFLQRIEVGGG